MAWWMWLLIWLALAALLITVLFLSGRTLVRAARGVGTEANRLIDAVAALDITDDGAEIEPAPNAIVRGRAAVAAERRAFVTKRDARRERRREARLVRARALITADAMQYAYLTEYKRREA